VDYRGGRRMNLVIKDMKRFAIAVVITIVIVAVMAWLDSELLINCLSRI
jgi:hypothetical protein